MKYKDKYSTHKMHAILLIPEGFCVQPTRNELKLNMVHVLQSIIGKGFGVLMSSNSIPNIVEKNAPSSQLSNTGYEC